MLERFLQAASTIRAGAAAALLALVAGAAPALAATAAPVEVKAELDRGVFVAGETQKAYLKVSITPARRPEAKRALMNVALVIDRSGSMASQARMENARRAAQMAVDRLGRDDILSVVSYDDRVEVEVPATKVIDPRGVKARIAQLSPRGSTAIHAGLLAGANEVRKFQSKDRVNRIILLSDGLANVGPSKQRDFVSLGRELASEGITVSTIGLGTGYNEDLMAGLARAADGGHVFVQESADLANFLAREFDDVAGAVGQEVEIIIRIKEGAKPIRSLGREARIEPDRIVYKVGALYGGVEQVLLAELEVTGTASAAERPLAEVEVAYVDAASGARATARGAAGVRFDSDRAAAEKSIQAGVRADVETLLSREVREEAIKLRDAGQTEEARKKFEGNAARLKKLKDAIPGLAITAPLQSEIEASEAAAAPAAQSPEGWLKARKIQRDTDGNKFGASQRY